jgi:replication factor C small subunit
MNPEEKSEKSEILSEKYRPKKLDDIIGQDDILKRLKIYIKNRNVPNLMFAGSPGTGKSTSAIVIAKELYGEGWHLNFKEINAGDDRGIDVIRENVKKYANVQSIGNVEFKIIFLDEADALTKDAQGALRRTIEKYSNSCRFILSCNYSSKIIEPIQSRMAVYRFNRLSKEAIIERCKYISTQEKINITQEALESIAYISEGDCRRAINTLDTARASTESDIITINDIYQVSALIDSKIINDIIKKALSGNFLESKLMITDLLVNGLSPQDITKQMVDRAMDLDINQKMLADLVDIIGETDWRISEGQNENMGCNQMIANIVQLGSLT